MKKGMIISIGLLLVIMTVNAKEQLDVYKEIPFSEIIYYTEYDPYEGGYSGIALLTSWRSSFFFANNGTGDWIQLNSNAMSNLGGREDNFCRNIENKYFVYGDYNTGGTINISTSDNLKEIKYKITVPAELTGERRLNSNSTLYITGSHAFWDTYEGRLVSWDINEDGGTVFHNEEETEKAMSGELGFELGYTKFEDDYFFGDTRIRKGAVYYGYIWKKLIFPEGKYENLKNLRDFRYIGGDKKGLSYFFNVLPSTYSEEPLEVIVAVLNTWTQEVTIKELAIGEWNPPRNENSGIQIAYSVTADVEGNIYFVDADPEKKVYQIKQLKNTWWDEIGVGKANIGQINTNHIPLQIEANKGSSNNGYNYENDYVQVLETKGDWSRVHKLDGREGWMESKYIVYE